MSRRVALLLCCLLYTATMASAQDPCGALLAGGVFNTFASSHYGLDQQQFHHAMCSGVIQASSSASSNDAALSFGSLKFDLGLSTSEAQSFQSYYQQKFCSSQDSSSLSTSQLNVFQRLVSPDLVQAYVSCSAAHRRGLESYASVSPDQNTVRFSLSFTPPAAGTPPPKLQQILLSPQNGVSCVGNIQPDQPIDSNQYFLQCDRTTDNPVKIAVVTQYGTVTQDLPARPQPPSATDIVMAALPKGIILPWYSRSGSVPVGWAICNGENGTPDLRNRFLMGTGDFAQVGQIGGSPTHTHGVTVGLSAGPSRGSDWNWGRTPWANTPNPVPSGTYAGAADTQPNMPPFLDILYIMKL